MPETELELRSEVKAIGNKILALEKAVQTLASRKETAQDPALIEDLTNRFTAKSSELDKLREEFNSLIKKLMPPLVASPNKGEEHESFWPFIFG